MDLVFKLEKDKTKEEVMAEITSQLKLIKDIKSADKINSYLVDPTLHFAMWDYSETEIKYPVWLIIISKTDDTGILFSEYGFGFGNWGLTKLSDNPFHFSMDNYWFDTIEEAFLNSFMAN
ncbi:MAG: hypothetical protein ABI691_22180 [Ginsengibacter sp.]